MSNYTPVVAYGPKDALSNGDPNKVIHGTQMDTELAAIASAISTKVDSPLTNLTINGNSSNYGAIVLGSPATSQSFGVRITAGTTVGDFSLLVQNASGISSFGVRGDGFILGGVGGTVDMTPSLGTISATFAGPFSAPVTITITYAKQGREVTLHIPRLLGTASGSGASSATAAAGTIPANLVPIQSTNAADHTQMLTHTTVGFSSGSIIWNDPISCQIGSDGAMYITKQTNWGTTSTNGTMPFAMRYLVA